MTACRDALVWNEVGCGLGSGGLGIIAALGIWAGRGGGGVRTGSEGVIRFRHYGGEQGRVYGGGVKEGICGLFLDITPMTSAINL